MGSDDAVVVDSCDAVEVDGDVLGVAAVVCSRDSGSGVDTRLFHSKDHILSAVVTSLKQENT